MKSKMNPEADIFSEGYSSWLRPRSLLVLKQGLRGMLGIKQSLAILSFLLIVGCAGNLQKYVGPSDDPRARVRFASTADRWVTLYSYDDEQCKTNEQEWMQLFGGYLFGSKTNPSLGMPLPLSLDYYPAGTVKEVYVVAGKPHHLMFQSARSGVGPEIVTETYVTASKAPLLTQVYWCGTPFTMEFEEGKDYEIVFHFDGLSCSVDVFNLALNTQGQYHREGMVPKASDVEPCKHTLKLR